jgi:hypothetical protein
MHPPHSPQNHEAGGAGPPPRLGLAAGQGKAFGRNEHLQAEGAAGCALAFAAVAGIDEKRYGMDDEANRFAGTTAAQRQGRRVQFAHDANP